MSVRIVNGIAVATVKPTVEREVTSREGLCPETKSDNWMHEDVVTDQWVDHGSPVHLVYGPTDVDKTATLIDLAGEYLSKGKNVTFYAGPSRSLTDTSKITYMIRDRCISEGKLGRLNCIPIANIASVCANLSTSYNHVILVDGLPLRELFAMNGLAMFDVLARITNTEMFITVPMCYEGTKGIVVSPLTSNVNIPFRGRDNTNAKL